MKKLLLLLLIFISTFCFSQETWGYLPIQFNNQHGGIYPINENVVHVVTDGGVFYKTVDGGETWTQFDSGVNVDFLDLVFDGPDDGYAVGVEGKILKTSDAGESWAELNSGTTEALISIEVNTPNSIWTVGNNGTILHSMDGGNTWTLNNSLTTERLNSIKFKDENIGYIAGNNGVLFYTENGGTDWEQLTISTTDDLFSINITDNYLYLMVGYTNVFDDYNYSGNQVFRSDNNIDWTTYFLNQEELAPADLFFQNDEIGFTINSAAMLCDCCYVWIEKTLNSAEDWDYSLFEETNSANCHANSGYADIKFASENVGYILLGRHILKTPYESAAVEDFNRNNSFTIYPNPTSSGKFNLQFNTADTQGLSVEILDMTGKRLAFYKHLKKDNSFNITTVSQGIYFVKLLKDGKMIGSKKLIKE